MNQVMRYARRSNTEDVTLPGGKQERADLHFVPIAFRQLESEATAFHATTYITLRLIAPCPESLITDCITAECSERRDVTGCEDSD